jgi:hypothetical protein
VIGWLFFKRIERLSEAQASNLKGRILMSIGTIALSITIRSIYLIFSNFHPPTTEMEKTSLNENDVKFPIFIFFSIIFIDALPMMLILLSIRYTTKHQDQLSTRKWSLMSYLTSEETNKNKAVVKVSIGNNENENSSTFG